MTPLARDITTNADRWKSDLLADKRFTVPAIEDAISEIIGKLKSAALHAACFDCTEIVELAEQFSTSHFPHHVDPELMFLPHRVTWLEFPFLDGQMAIALRQRCKSPDAVSGIALFKNKYGKRHAANPVNFTLGKPDFAVNCVSRTFPDYYLQIMPGCLLTIINQMGGIERVVERAHKGLERKLKATGEIEGELRPWTRLVLKRPVEPQQSPSSRANAGSSRKCYHFVRAHFRQANGQFVRPHWRGDPALGIGRKSYQVQL